MKTKRALSTVLATSLGSVGLASVAVAQQGAGPTLEEVVVTARRIEENINDAPLAVAVMSSDYIADQGIENMQDVFGTSPPAGGFVGNAEP